MLEKVEKASHLYICGDCYAFGTSTSYSNVLILSLLRDCAHSKGA